MIETKGSTPDVVKVSDQVDTTYGLISKDDKVDFIIATDFVRRTRAIGVTTEAEIGEDAIVIKIVATPTERREIVVRVIKSQKIQFNNGKRRKSSIT